MFGRNWRVELVKDLKCEQGRPLYGQCCYTSDTIKLEKDAPTEAQRADTLVHEIMHNVFYQCGCKLTHSQESSVATAVFTILRENPKLVSFITEA